MKDRIRQIRRDAHLTQEAFAGSIGATRAMIAQYEGGRVVPDASKIQLICMKYNVREAWLRSGEGEPYEQSMIPVLTRVLGQNPALNELLNRCLQRYGAEEWRQLDHLAELALKDRTIEGSTENERNS